MIKHSLTRSGLGSAKLVAAVLAGLLAGSVPAWAEKPPWAGGGHGNEQGQQSRGQGPHDKREAKAHRSNDRHENRRDQRRDDHREDRREVRRHSGDRHAPQAPVARVSYGHYFNDHQRVVVREYYEPRWRAGRCPPGLAKKGNGCMPPGQARKWQVGRPLPQGVVYYPVPQPVMVQLGVPPSGYRYVRVAGDILLLAVGTSMVVDAIQGIAGY